MPGLMVISIFNLNLNNSKGYVMNTAEFEFNIGYKAFDDIQDDQIEIVGKYRDFGVNCYECKTSNGDIVYRKESELI